MTIEHFPSLQQVTSEQEPLLLQQADLTTLESEVPPAWEEVDLDGENFKVKRDRKLPITFDGREIVLEVDLYEHPETQTKMRVYKLGLDSPTNEPTLIRADYGCPCMDISSLHAVIPGHDCGPQRQMMFDTMMELGKGVMVVIDENTAAGNGHGAHVVFDQSTKQHEAAQAGEHVPTIKEYYTGAGYFPFDIRRLDLPAKVMAHVVGPERSVIATTDNPAKLDHFRRAGMNVLDNGIRVELHTDPSGLHHQLLRRDGYDRQVQQQEAGPYLVYKDYTGLIQHTPLTKQSYADILLPQPIRQPIPTLI